MEFQASTSPTPLNATSSFPLSHGSSGLCPDSGLTSTSPQFLNGSQSQPETDQLFTEMANSKEPSNAALNLITDFLEEPIKAPSYSAAPGSRFK